jgi:WD40 repeat protein
MVVRWSDDGRQLAIRGGPDAGIWQWEPSSESQLFHFTKRSQNKVLRTAFHPRLPVIASAGPNGVRLWQVPEGRFLGKVGTEHTYDVAFNPRDGAIFINDVNGLATWPVTAQETSDAAVRLRFGPKRRLKLPAGADDLRGIAIDAAGKTLVTMWPRPSKALVVDLTTGEVKQIPTLPRVRYLAIDPAGRFAAFGTNKESDVDVLDLKSFGRATKLSLSGSAWPQFSGDGGWLAASGSCGYRVWEVGNWREVMSLPRSHESQLGLVAFQHVGRIAALTQAPSTVQLVDLPSQRVLANLVPVQRPPTIDDLDFSPDGSLLAVAQGNGGVRLWDLALMRRKLMELGLSFDIPLGAAAADKDQPPLEIHINPG